MPASKNSAAAYDRTLHDKSAALLRDIVILHPEFKNRDAKFKQWVLSSPRAFNIEFLFEQTLAYIGGYELVNQNHYDFSDKSDAKTSSVGRKPVNPGSLVHVGKITSMGREGSLKHGAIRSAIYIPHTDSMQYFYIPKRYWSRMTLSKSTNGELGIGFSYNRFYNEIPKFDQYRVPSLEALAKATG